MTLPSTITEIAIFLASSVTIIVGFVTAIRYLFHTADKKTRIISRLSLKQWQAKVVGFITLFVFLGSIAASFIGLTTEGYLSVVGSLFFLLSIFYMYVISKISREKYRLEKQIRRLHDAVHRLTPFMKAFTNYNILPNREITLAKDGDDLKEVLTRIANLFTTYTASDCSVSIKQFAPEPNEGAAPKNVFTLQRDTISLPNREHIDTKDDLQLYDWADNSAFKHILETNNDARAFFVENDLEALGDEYKNRNPDWRHFYNAALVVPISTSENPSASSEFYGFLCIDNFKGGFDQASVDLAFLLSKMILLILRRDDTIQSEENVDEIERKSNDLESDDKGRRAYGDNR